MEFNTLCFVLNYIPRRTFWNLAKIGIIYNRIFSLTYVYLHTVYFIHFPCLDVT